MPRFSFSLSADATAQLSELAAKYEPPHDTPQGLIVFALNNTFGFDPPLVQGKPGKRNAKGKPLVISDADRARRAEQAAKMRAARKAKRESLK
jgi:hypothetical protein